jgi:hypothetical protein
MALRTLTEPQQSASYDQLLAIACTAKGCGFSACFRSEHVLKMGSAPGPAKRVFPARHPTML